MKPRGRLTYKPRIVATGYDTPYGPFSRPLQFVRMHLWQPSSAVVTCPSAMQDGAACLLRRHLTDPTLSSKLSQEQRRVFEDAYRRLISRDPATAWTSGQWMTERTGGSDVSLTETVATLPTNAEHHLASQEGNIPLGPWSINGFKWFSSATDSQMTVLLARTAKGGLSTFFAPMRRHDPLATTVTGEAKDNGTRLNGVRISRLKNKFGTQSLPTAELILEDMRGWLIGDEGKGIQEISNILTITRVYSAVSATAYVGRSLAIAKAYTRVREVGAGNRARMRLINSPLHMRTLAKMAAEYRGLMLLSFYSSYILGVSEYPQSDYNVSSALQALTPTPQLVGPLIRVLSQLAKAYVCKPSVSLVFSCMECLGGVGYMNNEEQEYLNISRHYRDVSVLPIWEGTTDVLSTDFIRALKHPKAGQYCIAALDEVVNKAAALSGKIDKPSGWDAVGKWKEVKAKLAAKDQAELMGEARELLWAVGDILVSVLLFADAASDGDAASEDVFLRFVEQKFGIEPRKRASAGEELRRDVAIVYGTTQTQPEAARL